MKTCNTCGIKKEEEEFYKNKSSRDGLCYKCKACQKEYYENNKDKVRKRGKEYYKNNIEKIRKYRKNNEEKRKEYAKEWYKNNKDKIEERKKKWYKNSVEKMRKYNKKWRENNVEKMRGWRKEYYGENKDKIKEYYEENKDKIKEYHKNNVEKRKEYLKSLVLYKTYAYQISYAESTRHDPKNEELLQVKCAYCGKWFNPTIQNTKNRVAALEGKSGGEQRLYCSNDCKKLCSTYRKVKYSAEETNTKQLSREVQAELRQMVFERDNWTCIKCGETKALQCHHLKGILWEPIESADIDMCVTLCIKDHKKVHKKPGYRYIDLQCREEDRK